jgi:hypothetical protein
VYRTYSDCYSIKLSLCQINYCHIDITSLQSTLNPWSFNVFLLYRAVSSWISGFSVCDSMLHPYHVQRMLRYYFFPVPRYATNLITISILFFGFASVIQLLPRERSDLFGKEGGLPGAQENDTKWYHKQNVYSLKKNGESIITLTGSERI